MNKLIAAGCVIAALIGNGTVLAKEPVRNVSAKKQPNIAAAQKLAAEAYAKIEAAQKANEYDLEGHAQNAGDALRVANDELRLAAETANKK